MQSSASVKEGSHTKQVDSRRATSSRRSTFHSTSASAAATVQHSAVSSRPTPVHNARNPRRCCMRSIADSPLQW